VDWTPPAAVPGLRAGAAPQAAIAVLSRGVLGLSWIQAMPGDLVRPWDRVSTAREHAWDLDFTTSTDGGTTLAAPVPVLKTPSRTDPKMGFWACGGGYLSLPRRIVRRRLPPALGRHPRRQGGDPDGTDRGSAIRPSQPDCPSLATGCPGIRRRRWPVHRENARMTHRGARREGASDRRGPSASATTGARMADRIPKERANPRVVGCYPAFRSPIEHRRN
jgi:hypothetical protein